MTWPCLSSLQWIPWPQGHVHGRAARGSPPRCWLPFRFLGWSSCSIKGALWDGEGLSSVWWELLVFIKLSFLSLFLCNAVGNLQFFTLQKSVLSNTWNQMCGFFLLFHMQRLELHIPSLGRMKMFLKRIVKCDFYFFGFDSKVPG